MALPFLILATAARAPLPAGTAYRSGGAHRPFAAALSLAIAGGIGAMLMLALVVPDIGDAPTILRGTNIPIPDTPDPIVTPQPTKTPPRSIVTAPRPRILFPPLAETIITAELPEIRFPTIVIEPSPGGGTIGTTRPVDPPRALVFVAALRDPRFADRFQPAYPPAREREGVEGRCPVTVTIAPSGRVSAVASDGCTDAAFLAATERQALRGWRFRPATRDGVAVESTQTVAVTFRITDD